MISLEAKDLEIGYGDNLLLNRLNFSCQQGESVVIQGGIGVGKSSLLRVLGLLTPPQSGSLHIEGSADCFAMPIADRNAIIRSHFSYIFQKTELIQSWDALENVALPLISKGYSAQERRDKALVYCEQVGLYDGEVMNRPVSSLSRGQRQLVSLARAFAKQPKILIADEPIENLDPKTRDHVVETLLKTCRDQKMSLIMVTHIRKTLERPEQGIEFDSHYHIEGQYLHEDKPTNKKTVEPPNLSARA